MRANRLFHMKELEIRTLDSTHPEFDRDLDRLLARQGEEITGIDEVAAGIISDVRQRGDEAVLDLTRKFDGVDVNSVSDLRLDRPRLDACLCGIDPELRRALDIAASRIEDYHRRQLQESWEYQEQDGTRLGQRITPIDRVGIYVPGGTAAYPSSVLMNAIPARIAGVPEIVMTVPTPGNETNDLVLAAASLAGVDQVFRVGGAQAIAALAYGTGTIPRVDKIVGPGNAYVAAAKRLVFGQVGIDMIAGPSEVLVFADESVDPEWAAMDLLAQAEHDEFAQSILVSTSDQVLAGVGSALRMLLPTLEREDIARAALIGQGALIRVRDQDEASSVINRIAPEHLELLIAEPDGILRSIRHAGAIFVGRYSAEALGDYCVGPNHVLPTSGTARFSSPLGVYDFQKRSSVIRCSASKAGELAVTAAALARAESLTAHARSAEYRIP